MNNSSSYFVTYRQYAGAGLMMRNGRDRGAVAWRMKMG